MVYFLLRRHSFVFFASVPLFFPRSTLTFHADYHLVAHPVGSGIVWVVLVLARAPFGLSTRGTIWSVASSTERSAWVNPRHWPTLMPVSYMSARRKRSLVWVHASNNC